MFGFPVPGLSPLCLLPYITSTWSINWQLDCHSARHGWVYLKGTWCYSLRLICVLYASTIHHTKMYLLWAWRCECVMWILYLPSDCRVAFMVANISEHFPPHPHFNNKGQTTTQGTSCPTLYDKLVGCFTSLAKPTVYSPYPRRPERLTICRYNYKGSTFSSVILRPECWSGLGLEPSTSRTAVRRSTNWANQAAVKLSLVFLLQLKPRPNDHNTSTQHIPTLLAQHL